jgi:hypothetical protein
VQTDQISAGCGYPRSVRRFEKSGKDCLVGIYKLRAACPNRAWGDHILWGVEQFRKLYLTELDKTVFHILEVGK